MRKFLGLQYSGIPLATALAIERGSKFVFSTTTNFGQRQGLFSFIEDHRKNTQYYVYGIQKGDSIIVIEDEVTSGKGMSLLIKALTAYGIKVIAVCSAIETLTFGARNIVKTETRVDLISLIKIEVT